MREGGGMLKRPLPAKGGSVAAAAAALQGGIGVPKVTEKGAPNIGIVGSGEMVRLSPGPQ